MKKYIFLALLICPILLVAQENDKASFENEYLVLILDLINTETIGYKRHSFENNSSEIDFSQGTLLHTNRSLDFSIIGNGFFKIVLNDGRIAYTRAGEFVINAETNRIMTIDGYSLYDNIIIPSGYSSIYVDSENKLIAIYKNGENIFCGTINSYELNTSELYEDNIPRRQFAQMIPNFINRTGSMVVGIRGNGKNDKAIYFYRGDFEEISKSIIVNNYLENSNVSFFSIYSRLLEINKLLN